MDHLSYTADAIALFAAIRIEIHRGGTFDDFNVLSHNEALALLVSIHDRILTLHDRHGTGLPGPDRVAPLRPGLRPQPERDRWPDTAVPDYPYITPESSDTAAPGPPSPPIPLIADTSP